MIRAPVSTLAHFIMLIMMKKNCFLSPTPASHRIAASRRLRGYQLSRLRRVTARASDDDFPYGFFLRRPHVYAHPDLFSNCFGRKYKRAFFVSKAFQSFRLERKLFLSQTHIHTARDCLHEFPSARFSRTKEKPPPRSDVAVFGPLQVVLGIVVECD